jgi:hypothetical protein
MEGGSEFAVPADAGASPRAPRARLPAKRPPRSSGWDGLALGGPLDFPDLDVFTTWESNPTIVFEARGCGKIVHTIAVESADGQTVSHDYSIPILKIIDFRVNVC